MECVPSSVTRVFRFGLLPPRSEEERRLALQALGQASLYAGDLRRVYNAMAAYRRAIAAAEAEASHVRVWEKRLADADREARREATLQVYKALDDERNAQIRDVRSRRGHLLDAGTYWLLEDAALQAAKASGSKPLHSEPFDGTGRIGAAIQNTQQFDLPKITECERCAGTRRQGRCAHGIEFSTPRMAVRFETIGRSDRDGFYSLTIYVGALKEGHSITWPMKLHRPLPPGARLKQVAVQRIRRGHRFSWEALFTVAFPQKEKDEKAQGIVGVDVGWRLEAPKRMRVATHDGVQQSGDKPSVDALFIDTVDSLRYSSAVDGFRDDAFNGAKAYAANNGIAGAEHATQWRNKDRLHRLARFAKESRLPGSGDVGLVWWSERDRHLEDISVGVRGKALRRRTDAFRTYADALAKTYRYVVLEDMPMADWVGEAETSNRERLRSIAAVSELQNAILHRFGPDRVHWVPAQYTTRTCSDCGTVREDGVGPEPRWVCAGCSKDHHQDENAARVLRKMGERWIGDGNPVGARTRKSSKKNPKNREKAAEADFDASAGSSARKSVDMAAE